MSSQYPREYGHHSVHDDLEQDRTPGRDGKLRWSLRIGQITRVDYENMVCDIQWIEGESPPAREVPISSAYWGKRSFMGGLPEEGALVICGFKNVNQGKARRPFILSYLYNGAQTGKRFHPFGASGSRGDDALEMPEDQADIELEGQYGPTRHKFRKTYPGDILAMSERGSELVLDKSARLLDQGGSSFELRGPDGAALMSSIDYRRATSGARRRSGRVIRNALNVPSDLTNEDGKVPQNHPIFKDLLEAGLILNDGSLAPDVNRLPSMMLPSGHRQSILTENRDDPHQPRTRAYTEERLELQEFSSQRQPESGMDGFDADRIGPHSDFDPFIEKVTGTVFGNDPTTSKGRARYGRMLSPRLYASADDSSGDPRMETLSQDPSNTEKQTAAAFLYRMKRPDDQGELFVSHDKEGHVYLSVPSSSSTPSNLGGGRSVEADLKGSTKLTMGANQNDHESLDVSAEGGFTWSLGTTKRTGRSLDVTAKGGIAFEAGRDQQGSAYQGRFRGNWGIQVQGDIGIETKKDSIERVNGQKRLKTDGYSQTVGTGNMDRTVLGDRSSQVKGTVKQNIGKGRRTTIVKSPLTSLNADTTRILQGNQATTFLAPAQKKIKFVTAGTHQVRALGPLQVSRKSASVANYNFTGPVGSYSVSLGVGSINLTASVGTVFITGGASVQIVGAVIGLTGTVGLGAGPGAPLPVIGGIPGPSPHRDYLTGAPLKGNPLVRTV